MDPLKKAIPGDPLTFSATTLNHWGDAARAWRLRKGGNTGGQPLDGDPLAAANLVLVKWTGSDLGAFSVLTPSGAEIEPTSQDLALAARRQPVFTGAAPSAATDAVLITVEPILDGSIGRAAVAGVVPCRVNVSSASHGYAEPDTGTTDYLASAASGPARILWREGGTGEQWAIVLLEGTGASSSESGFFARLTDSSGGAWDFVKLKLSAGSYVDDGIETTGYPAVPLTIDGSVLCNPVADLRVWMIPSQQAGKYEFLPIGMADGTHPGLISLTTQTMGDGDKHFQQDVVIDQTLEVNADVIAGADVSGYGLPIFTVWATDGNGDDYPIIRVHQSTTNSVLLFGQDTKRPLNIYGWGGGVGFRATNIASLIGEGTTIVPSTFQVYSVDYGSGDVRPQFSFSNGTNSREALVQINVLHPGSLPAVAAFDVQHAISCQAQYWCQGDEGLTEDVAIPGADGNTYTLHFTGGIYIGYDVDPTGT